MKTMTCKQLGGACDLEFHADTFEEIAELSKKHGMQMYQQQDESHMEAMSEMQGLMQTPDAMTKWFENKRKEFDTLPND
jgi:predicted component of type VI protein secretion system